MFKLLFLVIMALVFIYMGWRMWKKEQITLIHRYHYQKVAKEDRKPYVEQIGKATILIGIGILSEGVIGFVSGTAYGWICFGICFALALIKMYKAQKKYNGSLF
ncbi:MAG: DUF3784 domain-containing protein [Cellulosilyticaceae bacterium]